MEQVLICTTVSAPTVPYIEDLLALPMDLSMSIGSGESTWWPDHSISGLIVHEKSEHSFSELVRLRQCAINQPWVNWFADKASAKNIITLYSFVKIWNAVYPQHHLSGVTDTLEEHNPLMKEEGESLQVTIDQINQKIHPRESYSLSELMSHLLDFISEHFLELYELYEFDMIVANDRPDTSIFNEDNRWANRLIVKVFQVQPYIQLMQLFDVVYLDGELIPPSQHDTIVTNDRIQYCYSVVVYSN